MPKTLHQPGETEAEAVWRNRYLEAAAAGLEPEEAALFAESTMDVGWLRKLVADGCAPRTIARIIT